ncbi:hypothetical protein ACFL67_02370 [candidate division KSB1 bacterium]
MEMKKAMSGFPRFIKITVKAIGALLLTAIVIFLISEQYQQDNEVATQAFDSLRNSLITMLADEQELPSTNEITIIVTDIEDIQPPVLVVEAQNLPDSSLRISRYSEKPALEELSPRRHPFPGARDSSQKNFREINMTSGKWSDRRKKLLTDLSELEKNQNAAIGIVEKYNFFDPEDLPNREAFYDKIGSWDNLFLFSLETLFNNLSMSDSSFKTIELLLSDENAMNQLKINAKNTDELKAFTDRISSFIALKVKMEQIAKSLGAEEDCGYHVPQLKLNQDFEITGYYQAYDCHPELVEDIMQKIKILPEWKRLVAENLR